MGTTKTRMIYEMLDHCRCRFCGHPADDCGGQCEEATRDILSFCVVEASDRLIECKMQTSKVEAMRLIRELSGKHFVAQLILIGSNFSADDSWDVTLQFLPVDHNIRIVDKHNDLSSD